MVSICLATYNGEKYLAEQIKSILIQLREEDELIISDDGSTDNTIAIAEGFKDSRISIYKNEGIHGVAGNFENALKHSNGDIIFFSDQDDVWLPTKIEEMSEFLIKGCFDVISCSCSLTDSGLNIIRKDYYERRNPLDKSAMGNFYKDLWLGCCMAFRRSILDEVLPFPKKIVAHDLWVAIYSQLRFKCGYYPKPLQLYRRHEATVSYADSKSKNSLRFKLSYRLYLLIHLIKRITKKSILK